MWLVMGRGGRGTRGRVVCDLWVGIVSGVKGLDDMELYVGDGRGK